MTNQELIKTIKVGDKIRCRPTHYRGGNSTRFRKVTAVWDNPSTWMFTGIGVKAHGYDEFWLKASEIDFDTVEDNHLNRQSDGI